MKLKDFTPGQIVYVVQEIKKRGITVDYSTTQYQVSSVGRTYLYIRFLGYSQITRFFLQDSENEYLTEKDSYSVNPRHLFLTEQAAAEYVEAKELRKWLRSAAEFPHVTSYSLKQLRACKIALEGDVDDMISRRAALRAVDQHTNGDGTLDDDISCILEKVSIQD